ncbi:unnamed protein product, partial [marine sediment metagenome]
LLENVSGLRRASNGSFVQAITESIEEAGNYNVFWKMLNAVDYGVPQYRERIFFVGVPEGLDFEWPSKTHGDTTENNYLKVKDAISDLPNLVSGESKAVYESDPITNYQRSLRKYSKLLLNHSAPNHPQSTIDRISSTKQGMPMYDRFKYSIKTSVGTVSVDVNGDQILVGPNKLLYSRIIKSLLASIFLNFKRFSTGLLFFALSTTESISVNIDIISLSFSSGQLRNSRVEEYVNPLLIRIFGISETPYSDGK